MKRVSVSPTALEDIKKSWDYLANEKEDTERADFFRDEVFLEFNEIARKPGVGHYRVDLAEPPTRFWGIGRYLIVYRETIEAVEIVHVLHQSQDAKKILAAGG